MENSTILYKFEAYLLTEKRVAVNTLAAYKKDIDQLADFLKKKKLEIQQVTLKDLKSFLKYLHKQSLSARSIARKISALKTLFSYLNDQFEWKNVAKDLRIPKMDKTLPHYLSEPDVEKLFAVADNDNSTHALRNKVMLYLMYTSGMRVSELVRLKTSDIQFDTGFITVDGKGGKQRIVPIPHAIINMLREYIDTKLEVQNATRKARTVVPYLFSTQYAGVIKPMSRQSFWIILKEMWAKTGSKKNISPHQLRHSLATHMLKKGVDLRSLQMILGHENLSTVQIYTHIETSYLRTIYDKKHPRS
ncbi:MAG TPA: tyrosine recombinase [Candidatus Dependentiae bacterium]|nr:tyrosine recombinase [Candidatus Dependentiae bacterium]HRQ62472.1 tyrosine recombinase [Candidatus Dependentiae bacterium]